MSINIQLDGKLQKISGQTMTKEKIVEKLGYTPANESTINTTITNLESTVDADIAAVNADLSDLKAALENYIKDHPDIVEDGSGEVVFTDEAGNIIAKLDADGFHTTDIEADSFISNDDNLIINDLDGNKIFQVDKDGVETTKLKLASGDIDEQLDSLAADIAAVEAKIPEIPVTSVNGKTGDVELEYSDLKNAPAIEAEENEKSLIITDNSGNIVLKAGHLDEADDKLTGIETTEVILPGGKVDERISGLTADLAAHTGNTTKHITDTERNTWNNKSDFSGEFKDLLNSPIEEDNSGELVYADESGNIALKIGKLDEETTGLETIEIKLKGGKVDERIETLTADLSEHKNNIDIHITKEERADWNAKATTKYVDDTVAAVVNSAPEVLNTLDELAAALGDDANFATTVTNKIAEKATQADFVAHRDDTVKHITAAERTTWNNKSEFSGNYTDLNGAPDISTDEEDNSLLVTDKTGNIVFKAGNLDENTTGIETATIKAKAADIDNIYDKLTVDAKLAALDEAKSNDGHGHIISAGATGDPIITLKGTSGDLAVSYEVSHAISGVVADTYTKVTVDAYGHVTEGDNPTTLAGFGITDAYTNEEVDAKLAAHVDATTAHNKAQVGLSNVDNTSDADKPISTATQTALDALKEEIVTESDSWTIVDESGNIMLKAGQLDNDVVGLETTTIIAETADIANIYNKEEVDAALAAKTYTIKANAEDDDVVILTGTSGANEVSYKAAHAETNSEGTYRSVTVNKYGHVTGGSNPTTIEGYKISDAYTKEEVDAAVAAVDAKVGQHEVTTQQAIADLKTELSEEIVSESNSWTIVDNSGNILLKAGELEDEGNNVGLETTTIKATKAEIGNIYNKTEIDAKVAALDEAKSDKGHTHAISAAAEDDNFIHLEGTSGTLGVSYKATHATPVANTETDEVYTKVSVDAKGHITSGSIPTTLAGYSISDAYTKEEVNAAVAAVSAEVDAHETNVQTALSELKTELSESITSESKAWQIVDNDGNVLLKAGELENEFIGLETTNIKSTTITAETAVIGNVYNKTEVNAAIAAVEGAKSDKGHTHEISAGASGDTEISLEGTPGTLGVSYKVTHTKPSELKADTYTKVTVNEYGHITAGSKPTEIADLGITNVYTKEEVNASVAAVSAEVDAHETAVQTALDELKVELSEEITSESKEWQIVDNDGNILLRAGELENNFIGLETTDIKATNIKAKTATIENVYNKDEIDAKVAALNDAKSDKGHDHDDRYYTEEEVDNKIAVAVTSALKYKGTKNTTNDLPASGNAVGDVWNIATTCAASVALPKVNAGDNVAWNGESWDVLAGTVDLSSYYTKSEVQAAVAAVSGQVDAHKTEVQTALEELETDLKTELSEKIVSESKEWQIVDTNGNILLRAGELEEGVTGLETTRIIADSASVGAGGITATKVTSKSLTLTDFGPELVGKPLVLTENGDLVPTVMIQVVTWDE